MARRRAKCGADFEVSLTARHVIGRASASVVALAWGLFAPAVVRANGTFPAVSQLVADADDPEHLVLRTTFGLLVTRDGGANWDWLCEAGAGYKDIEPALAVLPGGVILLGVPGGVSRSDATGCNFVLSEGIDANVFDLARVPSEPDSAVAISGTGTDAQLWRTTDGGKSFSASGDAISDFIPATVDVAATDANVIYASGLAGTMGALLRSSDAGKTFTRFALPSTMSGRQPFIAAVDPRNADTVYVRFDVQGNSPLAVTHDGGKSFVTPLTTTVSLAGFALSPDGKTVIASNAYDGTFRADADTLVFEKVACSGPTCLSFSAAGLFGCGDQSLDGFIVGRSDDFGATFQRSVDLTCVRGPVACDSATSVGSLCPAAWPYVQSQLGATECSPPEVQLDTSCLGDAGAGAVGTAGETSAGGKSGGAGGASVGKAGSGSQSSSDTASSRSCGCRATSAAPRETAWWLGVMSVWVTRRRRRLRARSA